MSWSEMGHASVLIMFPDVGQSFRTTIIAFYIDGLATKKQVVCSWKECLHYLGKDIQFTYKQRSELPIEMK